MANKKTGKKNKELVDIGLYSHVWLSPLLIALVGAGIFVFTGSFMALVVSTVIVSYHIFAPYSEVSMRLIELEIIRWISNSTAESRKAFWDSLPADMLENMSDPSSVRRDMASFIGRGFMRHLMKQQKPRAFVQVYLYLNFFDISPDQRYISSSNNAAPILPSYLGMLMTKDFASATEFVEWFNSREIRHKVASL